MHYLTRQPSKEKETTPESRVPACSSCHGMISVFAKGAAKTEVSEVSAQFHLKEQVTGIPGTAGAAGRHQMVKNRKADCCTLLKRITELKCVSSEFKSVNIDPTTEVASRGPMALCRSHHRNHTRQEWIIIWSGRNWILKHADWFRNNETNEVSYDRRKSRLLWPGVSCM